MKPRLICRKVTKSFQLRKKTLHVLKGVDFEIFPGEIGLIKGRSGQGKSTLLWLMAGIDVPDSGEVIYDNTSYQELSSNEIAYLRRNKIGLIFQNFNLISSWTAEENIASALAHGPLSTDERKNRVHQLMNYMDLVNCSNNLPSELSIGQQQRVALARALIHHPLLILADEPTGNVDDETAQYLISYLETYVKEKQASMIITTHGSYQGQKYDRFLTLENGILK